MFVTFDIFFQFSCCLFSMLVVSYCFLFIFFTKNWAVIWHMVYVMDSVICGYCCVLCLILLLGMLGVSS